MNSKETHTPLDHETLLRLKTVDRLLRSRADGTPYAEREGATYRDMVRQMDLLDKETKKELGLADNLLDDALYESMRGRMQKTVETLCDIYAAVHGIATGKKGEDKYTRRTVREILLVEIPRTKETGGKQFRYKDSSYSLFDSGDYEAWLTAKESITIRVFPSAYEELQAFKRAEKLLEKKRKDLLQGFVLRKVRTNRLLLQTKSESWKRMSLKNLQEAVDAIQCSKTGVSYVRKASLLLSYAALLLLMGEAGKAVGRLREVIALCAKSRNPDAPAIAAQASQLLNELTAGDALSIYSSSLSRWTTGRRMTGKPLVPQAFRMAITLLHQPVSHPYVFKELEPMPMFLPQPVPTGITLPGMKILTVRTVKRLGRSAKDVYRMGAGVKGKGKLY